VVRLQGCLGGVADDSRQVLELRAGLDGEPLSLGETAEQLGISDERVAHLESRGVRQLRTLGRGGACGGGSAGGGGSGAGGPRDAASLGLSGLPELQPAILLASMPELKPMREVADDRDRERQDVLGATASSEAVQGIEGGSPPPDRFAASSRPLSNESDGDGAPAYPFFLVALLALGALVTLLTVRQRQHAPPATSGHSEAGFASGPEAPAGLDTVTAATTAPPAPAERLDAAPEPAAEELPAAEGDPSPQPPTAVPPATTAHHPHLGRASAPAAVIASGILSLVVRRLMRRRERRRHH
jgi:hypothetical protein